MLCKFVEKMNNIFHDLPWNIHFQPKSEFQTAGWIEWDNRHVFLRAPNYRIENDCEL